MSAPSTQPPERVLEEVFRARVPVDAEDAHDGRLSFARPWQSLPTQVALGLRALIRPRERYFSVSRQTGHSLTCRSCRGLPHAPQRHEVASDEPLRNNTRAGTKPRPIPKAPHSNPNTIGTARPNACTSAPRPAKLVLLIFFAMLAISV